jgi:hypothetical protein
MEAKMESDKTLTITPENTAEMVALKAFIGGKVEVRQPQPFAVNVQALTITRPEEPKP